MFSLFDRLGVAEKPISYLPRVTFTIRGCTAGPHELLFIAYLMHECNGDRILHSL